MDGSYQHRVEYYFDEPLHCLFDLAVVGSVHKIERSREWMKLPLVLSLLFLFGCATPDAIVPPPGNIIVTIKPNQCVETAALAPLLLKQYNEKLISSGVVDTNNAAQLLMMMFVSESGSWTLATASSNNVICVLLWGRNHTVNKPKKRGEGI